MRVNALDHVNIVTDDVARTARFYAGLLGLEPRNGPGTTRAEDVQWLHDEAGRAILHINRRGVFQPIERDTSPGSTGAVHHVALRCEGHQEMKARLRALDLAFVGNDVCAANLRQIFVEDPNGVLLELNFFGD